MVYSIEKKDISYLEKIRDRIHSVFLSPEWLRFLEKNQNGEAIVLLLKQGTTDHAVFVGMLIQKMGIRILGSPFEGWLTCDMGFIRIESIDIDDAIEAVKDYAFRMLKCHYIQIIDKNIDSIDSHKYLTETTKILKIDNSVPLEEVLNGFTKNGRRDVRASGRKGLKFVRVPFDKRFAEIYYEQLVDVFSKQNLKPFYDLKKVLQLVEAFKNAPDNVCSLMAFYEDKCVATVFSFAVGEWAYFVGAASFREYQKYLPNEGLFWEFVKYWNERGIKNIDLVGYREYKLKYNPTIIEAPVIIIQRYPFIHSMKRCAYEAISLKRKVLGKFQSKQ